MMASLTLAVILSAADLAGVLDPEDASCRVIHHAADGTRHDIPPSRPYTQPPGAAVSTSSSGKGQARSSSSVSASSSSSGRASSVVRSESNGRSITKSYDKDGCTIVIDDRPA